MRLLTVIHSMLAICLTLSACAAPVNIGKVQCVGATALTEGHVYDWLQQHLPPTMNAVEPVKLRRQLLADIPLAAAEIERKWPGTIAVRIRERTPYAMLLAEDGRIAVVDRSGRPVTLRTDQRVALWDRPAIRGCEIDVTQDGPNRCVRRALGFMSWIDHVQPDWLSELSEIRIEGESVIAYLNDGIPIRFMQGPLAAQLKHLAYAWSVAAQHKLQIRGVQVVDDNRVVFRTIHSTHKTGA